MNTKSLIKLALSILMAGIVFRSVNFENLRATFLTMSPMAVVLVVVGYTIGQLLSSAKWWTIARSGGITTPYPDALKAYFIGMFLNCFSFGMLGGDAARGILVAQGQPKKTEGLASVVADRVHGLIVLSCIALVTSAIMGSDRVAPDLIQLLLLLVIGCTSGWLIGPWLLPRLPFMRTTRLGLKLQQVMAIFPRDPKTLIFITGISIVFHLLQISLHAVMAAGMGIQIPFTTLLLVIPFVNIVCSLPISWNGLGVREKAYTYFLTTAPAIVSYEQAVAFGAIWLLAVTVSSAIGGIVAMMSEDLRSLKAQPGHKPASSSLP
ncbi:MAG: hypothetical protein RL518_803 [Pseudomonadota bacterium]|jgi:uncharacterized membrane protein YbhN (UPF0104 family)